MVAHDRVVDTSNLAERLGHLGLTSYEAKAYIALVRRDSYTAAQVSRMAALPRQRIYDVLGSLVAKGLATSRPGSVVKYAAVAPDLAIERLVEARRSQMLDLEREAAETIAALAPAYTAGQTHTDPLEYVELLRDRGAINERFAELQASVRTEIPSSRSRRTRHRRRRTSRASRSPGPTRPRASTSSRSSTTRQRSRASGGSSRPASRRGSWMSCR